MLTTPSPAAYAPLPAEIKKTAQFIASQQMRDGAIPWFENGKLDPWDHTEAAMGLSVAGLFDEAERAYLWLAETQLADGSWWANYFEQSTQALRETNFIAYVATGIWHHYCVTGRESFLARMWPMVERAINFVLQQQSSEGEIAWAVDSDGAAQNDALITGCSSILRSLECAVKIARTLNFAKPKWLHGGHQLAQALQFKPFRFDRTWESKSRFAMDWYYPILSGVLTPKEMQTRLQKRWHEFVKPNLGCRCVNDEPWVTMAETSELVIALVAAQHMEQAQQIFAPLERWCTEDGGYWTGYVYKDNAIWPEETTTWTAGAVLLAADALHRLTPAHRLFTEVSIFR